MNLSKIDPARCIASGGPQRNVSGTVARGNRPRQRELALDDRHNVSFALAQGEPHIYVQQGPHQGGYADEIAIDPINLQPGDEKIIAVRLGEELTRRH